MITIHRTAIIEDGAQLDESVQVGPYAVIGPNVKIGRGTTIGPHAVIDGHTTIGEDCRIFAGASIGLEPQDLGYKNEPTRCVVGDRCTIREYATIHRGTGEGVTTVGDDCFLMNYTHIAHDCTVGKGVIMANAATLGGHVTVGDYSVMAGICVVHQWCRLGKLLMISGLAATRQDLPPYSMCDGRPMKVRGVNTLGMKRQKLAPQVRSAIKEAYRIIYRTDLGYVRALEKIDAELEPIEEIREIVDFFRSSKRGVVGYDSEAAEGEEVGAQ